MGAVYRAFDENLSMDVAVKENFFSTDEYSRQFKLEANILASVRNPHLPRATDYFVIENQGQYLVMDYIEGEDLRERVERLGNISEEDAILIGAAVCDALTYLHKRKPLVLHRDIKPGNIKITSLGEIYLVDFGLVKVVEGSQTTTTGARAMTPGYSPPEQYGSARTDPRTDIYSLGATLYAALSGKIPEDGLARVMDNVPLTPIREHNPEISRGLAAAIEKAMEAYPDDRYQTAEDFRIGLLSASSKTLRFIDLDMNFSVKPGPKAATNPELSSEELLEGSHSGWLKLRGFELTRASLRFRRLIRRVGLLQMVLGFAIPLVVIGLLWIYFPKNQGNTPGTQVSSLQQTETPLALTQPEITSLKVLPTFTIEPTRAAIGSTPTSTEIGGSTGEIAFVSTRTGNPQVYTMQIDGSNIHQVTNERDGACQPDWSPDGSKIVYVAPCRQKQDTYQGSSLFIVDLATRAVTSLPASPGGDFEPAWSPDGDRIAFTSLRDGYMEIYMYNLVTTQFTRLTRAQKTVGGIYARQPAWNPYGTQIVYVLKRMGLSQIWVTSDGDVNMNKPNSQLVLSGNTQLDSMPVWSPDGKIIVFDQTNFNGTAPFKIMSIRYEDRDTKQAVPINIEPLPVVDVSFSPDGQWLAYESWPDNSYNQDIYIATISGANRTRLTTDPGMDFDPVWCRCIRK